MPQARGTELQNGFHGLGKGPVRDQSVATGFRKAARLWLLSPTPRHQLLRKEDLPLPTAPSAQALGSSGNPSIPPHSALVPPGSERPLPEPHRTLQLPKPKRGALLSAGIRVVVKRLHRLVHELQGWLGSLHAGGSGDEGSEEAKTPPKASACSASERPHCLGHSRSLTGAISSFLAVTRDGRVPRGSGPLRNCGEVVFRFLPPFCLVFPPES